MTYFYYLPVSKKNYFCSYFIVFFTKMVIENFKKHVKYIRLLLKSSKIKDFGNLNLTESIFFSIIPFGL